MYGDWTTPNLRGWKDAANKHAIQPIQQFAYTTGKNATDSAMIIDAMDLLYTDRFDGFVLVSSDSDFTRLAARIRESGVKVYGFGERKTPEAFVVGLRPVRLHGRAPRRRQRRPRPADARPRSSAPRSCAATPS